MGWLQVQPWGNPLEDCCSKCSALLSETSSRQAAAYCFWGCATHSTYRWTIQLKLKCPPCRPKVRSHYCCSPSGLLKAVSYAVGDTFFVRFKVRMDLALSRHSLRSSTWVMEVAVNLWVRVKLPEIITELEGVIWICDHYIQTIKMKCFMIFQWSCNMSYLFFKLESLGHSVWPLPDKTSWQTAAVCPGLTEDSSENLEIHLLTLECKMCVRLTQPFFFFF